jgi:hypothetical protein
MRMQADSTKSGKYVAARMTAPSPLAGEGIADSRSEYCRVRGTGGNVAMSSPLTRLRFAKPPSPARGPARGEGKKPERPFIPLHASAACGERLARRVLR